MDSEALSLHDINARAITKLKPKVRIVHILAPEIIKTEPANFRELVQRLTGKPTKRTAAKKKKKKKKSPCVTMNGEAVPRPDQRFEVEGSSQQQQCQGAKEEESWPVEHNSGDFLGDYLGEIDGFLQGLSDLPLLPLSSSHRDGSDWRGTCSFGKS